MSMYGEEYAGIKCVGTGRTKQSMKDECDVNLIVAKFDRTGLLDHLAEGVPYFEDVSEVGDYRAALENVRAAQEYFSKFPAKVRSEFGNDVTRFMTFLRGASDGDLLELGLEVLDRRVARSQDAREGDVVTPPPPEVEEASGTVPT